MKTIGLIAATILILFGVLFVWGSFDPVKGNTGWIIPGLISIAAGCVIIYFATRKPKVETTNVTLQIDMPGNVSMDTLKCKSCGGVISENDVKVVAGAAVVTCPYCKTSYQLTEEPKW